MKMNRTNIYCLWLLMLGTVLLTACHTSNVVTTNSDDASFVASDYLQTVNKQATKVQFITSKLKFTASLGSQKISVGGSLKMKRDDVIRIQLVALGIMEAGRLEFTRDYVLIMDRINKRYVKAKYDDIDYLKSNGINLYTLQALFWNELFQPGRQKPSIDDFTAVPSAGDAVLVGYDKGNLNYQWGTIRSTGQILSASARHQSKGATDAQMDWDYSNFKKFGKQQFPNDMQVSLRAKGKSLKIELALSSLGNDKDWEPHTDISSKYKAVDAEDIFRLLMKL